MGTRLIWLAASTREGEEALILDAFTRTKTHDLLLLLVPRHPQRFTEVAAMVEERGLSLCRRSEGALPTDQTQIWLGDSMGEMPAYYSVGGCRPDRRDAATLRRTEPDRSGLRLPVLVGPHTFNFLQATEDLTACGAAKRVANEEEVASAVEALLEDRETLRGMRNAAMTFSQAHRGATARTMVLIRNAMARREKPG